MRIITFPKLISNEAQVRYLKNCSVVIDGQNYLYHAYKESMLPYVFGSEADNYAKYLRYRFGMFKEANVKCYIVIKGGDPYIEKKINGLQTTNFDFDTNQYLPPVITKDVFKDVLNEIGVAYSVCVGDSKDESVALALKLGCPVISYDIEFCFKKAPYVPHLTIQYDNATNSIKCRQYKLQEFLQNNSLTEKKAAIFAALSDITLFPEYFFDSLLQTWGVLHEDLPVRHRNLLKWLSQNSDDVIRGGITNALSSEYDENKFWIYCDNIMESMRKNEAGIVSDYLIDSKLIITREDPLWFEKGVATKKISSAYVNLYTLKLIEGSLAIEDTNGDDSIMLSMDIIKYVYNLLTNFKGAKIHLYRYSDCHIPVEIDTEDTCIKKPNYRCKESVFENGCSQVKRFKLFEHFLSENQIKTEALVNLPEEAIVLFISLVYFARKKLLEDVDVTNEVYAVLISYVMLNVVFDKKGSFTKVYYGTTEADCTEAEIVTAEYFKFKYEEAVRIFDDKVLKILAELQYCVKHMNNLNVLCGSPYRPISFHRTFNCTFIYKMINDMQKQNVDVFIDELFATAPSVLKFIKKLILGYQALLNLD